MKRYYFVKCVCSLLFLIVASHESAGEIIKDKGKSIKSVNTVETFGSKVTLTFSKIFVNNFQASYSLSILVKDKRDFWLFDSSRRTRLILDIGDDLQLTTLDVEKPASWIGNGSVYCTSAFSALTEDIVNAMLDADDVILSFEVYCNVYTRKMFFTPEISREVTNEWYFVHNDSKRVVVDKEEIEHKTGKEEIKETTVVKNREKQKPLAPVTITDRGVSLTKSTKERISKALPVGTLITLKYDGGVDIYESAAIKTVAFKVPSGTEAKVIDSIINTAKSTAPNLFKVEMEHGERKYYGWVTAYVAYDRDH